MDRPQPARRLGQERHRIHEHERDAPVDREQERPDEAHVVVERQPADRDVGAADLQRLPDRVHVGDEVLVREQHALGEAGRAARVLDERGVVGRRAQIRERHGALAGEVLDVDHVLEGLDAQRDLAEEAVDEPVGEAHARAGVTRHVAQPVDGHLDAQPGGRVGGHGNRAQHLDGEERGDELERGRQHDQHAVALLDADDAERARHACGRVVDGAVAVVLLAVFLAALGGGVDQRDADLLLELGGGGEGVQQRRMVGLELLGAVGDAGLPGGRPEARMLEVRKRRAKDALRDTASPRATHCKELPG
jgi:hypothetical protein